MGETKMPFVKIIDTVGSSPESWEQAAKNAIEEASDLPIFKRKGTITKATIKGFDVEIRGNKIAAYLCRVEMFLSGNE
jgi:flavin-binding protein dodecin